MRFILCQPAIKRFQWELDVCINNLVALDYTDIILLFGKDDPSVTAHFKERYPFIEVHEFEVDWSSMNYYQPAIKPYLWKEYIKEFPEASEHTYFYMDSDVIFRECLDIDKLITDPKLWIGSDCGHYLNYDYIRQCTNGELILADLSKIVDIPLSEIQNLNYKSVGAQWVITKPQFAYWDKVYDDTLAIWKYFQSVDSNIQKWTAEMWAQLFNTVYFGIAVEPRDELDFCWATDPIHRWYETKIYHNAGATFVDKGLFFKGLYDGGLEPFDADLSFVDPERCSIKYVEAIKGVKMTANG